ncbi:PREDICTED: zinc finger BED domain-containing protein 1-like [Wasmannia auropunctata]|uniref:zinc finger BED domain-containing protein 1-like n=1 Tax=Wasmannia auropunctata TaxID=64793 RepID=UPI0005EE3925|nr:PREDICTED: zinc finger BED domain-containing protein 1-like [Wasmannia auropunctata]
MDESAENQTSQFSNVEIDFDAETKARLFTVFSETENTPIVPVEDDYSVKVSLKDHSTYAYAPRRFAWAEREQIRAITDDLLERDIIQYSTSPYCARVVPVRKRNGTLHNTRQPPRKRKLKRKADEVCSTDRKENISQALARLIIINQLPLSFAETEGFRQFMATIEPGYVVPATKTILSRLQLIYDEVKTCVQREMQRDNASISCSTDIWTSLSQDAYLSVTAHYIDKEKWELRHYTLCTIGLEERHTAENIALGLEMIFSDWDVEHQIFTLVHDNAANMINAGEILQNTREHIGCAAHTLQLAVNDALQLEEIECIIQKARKIVGHFKHSALATQELHNTQIKLNFPEEALIQSCPTRWNSTYYMCERLYKNRTPILAVLNNNSVTKPVQARNLEMTASEWSIINELVSLLKPLQCATTIFCSSSEVTISLVRPVIRGIIDNHLTEDILDGNLIRTLKLNQCSALAAHFEPIPEAIPPTTAQNFTCARLSGSAVES